MKVSELEGAELDYWVAKAQGARFWEERRGEYLLCVYQAPGAKEPYKSSRDWEEQAMAIKCTTNYVQELHAILRKLSYENIANAAGVGKEAVIKISKGYTWRHLK